MRDDKINKIGDQYEAKSYRVVSKVVNRLLDAFFHFKKRKGEIMAGATTFFGILSFGPILLFFISVSGWLFDSELQARNYVLSTVQNAFPKLAPWIFKSISSIVDQQLAGGNGLNILSTVLFLYASLGVISTLIFGLKQISSIEIGGGFFVDDLRSFFTGIFVAFFITSLMFLSHKPLMNDLLIIQSMGPWNAFAEVIIKYNILPSVVSLGFFTLFYKMAMPGKVTLRDSFLGACAFVGSFIIGKSFYWIYHLYSKDTLAQSYGNFYTLVIAVFWVYYLMCSLFYGASVACVKSKEIYLKKSEDNITPPVPVLVDIPKDIEEEKKVS